MSRDGTDAVPAYEVSRHAAARCGMMRQMPRQDDRSTTPPQGDPLVPRREPAAISRWRYETQYEGVVKDGKLYIVRVPGSQRVVQASQG